MLLGFYALMKGADLLVTGAGSMAKRWGISSLVIGLTIVAFGTSAPEFFVNVTSSFRGASGITLGNVIGSNLANILLGIGIIAMIKPIIVGKGTAWKEIPFLVLATFLLWSCSSDAIIDGESVSSISRSEALMFLGFFILFMVYTFGISKAHDDDNADEVQVMPLKKSLFLFILGVGGLALGGEIVVRSATEIARSFHISETIIGLTIVALGTSIPDIMTTIIAAKKQNVGMAVGNIIGSNIFNILWVLAVSALINPIPIVESIQPDLLFTFGITVLLLYMALVSKPSKSKKYEISRFEGSVLVTCYAGYMIFLVLRG